MLISPEVNWIGELCRLHRPRLTVLSPYPPSGDPDHHDIDALVGQANTCENRIAVEATLCYRGSRLIGEARLEQEILGDLSEWLERVARGCIDVKGHLIAFSIYFPELFSVLRPRIRRLLTAKTKERSRFALSDVICRALRSSMAQNGRAEMLDLSLVSSEERVIIHAASQAYVRRLADSESTQWSFDFREKSGPNWRPVVSKNYGINLMGIRDGIQEKRQKLGKYRTTALRLGASSVWLLLVAEFVFGLDLFVVTRDEERSLESAMQEKPQFDEVYLLAGGVWSSSQSKPPEYAERQSWECFRLWPAGARV